MVFESVVDFFEAKTDPRTRTWFMVDNPGLLATLLVAYVYFCSTAGPRWMKDRKPFDLKGPMLIYNALQVIMSAVLVYEGLMGGWWNQYNFTCQNVDFSDNPTALRMARAVWLYYICKLTELLDTVAMVLRKKNRQVSGLHLWHHTLMPITSYIGVRFLPGGHGTLLGVINSFVHVVMYSYYLLAGLGPEYQKLLWWKKYLTLLQLVQFLILTTHSVTGLVTSCFGACSYPKFILVLLAVNQFNFIIQFGRFYIRTYQKEKKKSVE